MYHLVSVQPTLVKSKESPFFEALLDRNKARAIFGLPDHHPAYISCTCTSSEFAQTGSISEEIGMVLVFLGLLNARLLTQNIVPRASWGRPTTLSSWADTSGGNCSRDAA